MPILIVVVSQTSSLPHLIDDIILEQIPPFRIQDGRDYNDSPIRTECEAFNSLVTWTDTFQIAFNKSACLTWVTNVKKKRKNVDL